MTALEEVLREFPGVVFWTPPSGAVVHVGPEQVDVPLPACPLPLSPEDLAAGSPSDDAIGRGVYDFLRRYPDSSNAAAYASLLRDAYPHYLADIASQIVMIDAKKVDAPYVQRKVTGLKILAHLETSNPDLWLHLGLACLELGLMFSELPDCRRHVLAAMGNLQRSLDLAPNNPSALHHLALIDFWLGDYPTATARWRSARELLNDGDGRAMVDAFLMRLSAGDVPDHPLIDDLEQVGTAMRLLGGGQNREALALLEALEEEGSLTRDLPMAEFHHLLGLCRERCGDPGGAYAAYQESLVVDAEYLPAKEGIERIEEGRCG